MMIAMMIVINCDDYGDDDKTTSASLLSRSSSNIRSLSTDLIKI